MHTENQENVDLAIRCFNEGKWREAASILDQNRGNDFYQNSNLLHLRGRLAFEMKDYDVAKFFLEKSLAMNSFVPSVFVDYGRVLYEMGRTQEAFQNWGLAVMLDPKTVDAYAVAGNAHFKMRNYEPALKLYERILEIDPSRKDVKLGVGLMLVELGLFSLAEKFYDDQLSAAPNDKDFLIALAQCFGRFGKVEEATNTWKKAIELAPIDPFVYAPYLMSLLYSTDHRPTLLDEHRRVSDQLQKTVRVFPKQKFNHKKIRIGYLSPNLNKHALRHFLEPILINHDRDRFDIYIYQDSLLEDEVTERFKKYALSWQKVSQWTDEMIAERIRQDEIDIMVNLTGYSDVDRARVFLMKPAVMQVSWMAYSSTTGMSTMDYRIVDPEMAPPGVEIFYSENLIRLKKSVCFRPSSVSPKIESLPMDQNGFITFGCFSQLRKMTPQMFLVWSEILKNIPNSRLALIVTAGINYQHELMQFFVSQDIQAHRILILGEQSFENYLRFCNQIDVMLDTFPMGGGVTTYQSLWMGVPMLALEGKAESSRMSSMILKSYGLDEFVATSPEDYIERAIKVASAPERLRWWRREARNIIKDEGEEFTREWESKLLQAFVTEEDRPKSELL